MEIQKGEMMVEQIKNAIQKAKEIVEEMNLEEPYKSLTYSKLLEKFLDEENIFSKNTNFSIGRTERNEPMLSMLTDSKLIDSKTISKKTISDLLNDLKMEGFFDQPKFVKDIVDALANKGYHYESNSLTWTLQNLIRKGVLGRIKREKIWAYTKR